MASTSKSLILIPDDLLIQILARVASISSEDLDRTMCTCKKMKRIGEFPEVYRLARMRDEHIVALCRQVPFGRTPNENRYISKCVEANNPFKAYALALYSIVEKEDAHAALLHLGSAQSTDAFAYPAEFLKCICLLFTADAGLRSEGLELLHSLRSRGILHECRKQLYSILVEMRWCGYRGLINCNRTAPLCANQPQDSWGCWFCDRERRI